MAKKDQKLDAVSMGLSWGILWAAGVFIAGLGSNLISSWTPFVNWLSQFYIGYSATFFGSLAGAFWGFLDLGIGAFLVIWLYNKIHDYRNG